MKKLSLAFVAIFILFIVSKSQPVISFQTITTGLVLPLDVVNAKDGSNRLFVVEKAGTIRIWNGSSLLAEPFLDIRSIVRSTGNEQGLLSLAFHPNYTANGYFYVWYNNLLGHVTLARYSRSGLNAADPASGVILLSLYKPFTNHNGADLNFGPDGYLYFGTGDGGGAGDPANRAQNGDTLLGKMIRIDVNNPNPPYYSIPPTNPYINDPAIRDEIIAIGMRNPWRWSFDRETGDMWIADVGQNLREEVNFRPADSILGLNYGWRCYEGTPVFNDSSCNPQPNYVFPIFEYPHDNATGGRSITGGFVYRGTEFPFLQGYYITSDYVSNRGWLIKSDGSGGWNTTMQATWAARISSYGEGEDGTLYAVSLTTGTLFKLVANNTLPLHVTSFSGRQSGNYHELNWHVQNEEAGDVYILEKRANAAQPFVEVSRETSVGNNATNKYTTKVAAADERTYYRLQIKNIDGRSYYTLIIVLEGDAKPRIKGIIVGNTLQLSLRAKATSLVIFDAAGKKVFQKRINNSAQMEKVSLQNIAKGILTIRVQTQEDIETIRVLY
jgi:glucose/arabinose dehydrogenase